VQSQSLDGAAKFLHSCASTGADVGKFSYRPGDHPTAPMSAIGVLATEWFQTRRDSSTLAGGGRYLMANQPEPANHDVYYWYHATQAMRGLGGKSWDTWREKIRELLVNSQAREGCAAGSWDPTQPNQDAWGRQGGRVMVTSFSCLTLEVLIGNSAAIQH
jgi:hypothetical protein